MSEPDDRITCATHGETPATFICQHLAVDPAQRWHCAYPSEEVPWPDAWCDKCNLTYVQDDGWSDQNGGDLGLKILCSQCYEKRIALSVDRLSGAAAQEWGEFVAKCHTNLHRRQDALEERYSIGSYSRFDWDQERAEIVFSDDGVPKVVSQIEFVGSVSTSTETWLWSWANPNTLESVRRRITAVRDLGEFRDFPRLIVPKWTADVQQGWDMAAIAAHVLNAQGVYRPPMKNGFLFVLLTDTQFVQ